MFTWQDSKTWTTCCPVAQDLAAATSRVQYPQQNGSPGPTALTLHHGCHPGRGGHEPRGRGLSSLPITSLLHLGGNQDITEQGLRVIFPDSTTFSYLLVSKESLVTDTPHPEILVTIFPCTRASHSGKCEHNWCIQHKFAKIIAIIRIFYVPGTVQSPL